MPKGSGTDGMGAVERENADIYVRDRRLIEQVREFLAHDRVIADAPVQDGLVQHYQRRRRLRLPQEALPAEPELDLRLGFGGGEPEHLVPAAHDRPGIVRCLQQARDNLRLPLADGEGPGLGVDVSGVARQVASERGIVLAAWPGRLP